ncbi:RND efflux system, outer membrane lipoprotein, NodT family [Gluconacetobacter diazotrophicus PA1 5]|nr:efflux transporter outer membrane subunit [Gluconacetobacter diazotrophicus]ACI51215.1 RND efflux system, outer membrane lipoprotein, NodT family [Gluconacetobacter diazotrophicus PA1 5]TWB09771.1 NodT family efflux transporter outer membrane factor (OMF) lipoprotein [Gluconacetobacter diazotrophicus]
MSCHSRAWRVLMLLAAMVPAACDLAPRYAPPVAPVPASFKERDGWALAVPGDDVPKGPWWRIFHDPVLDALEDRVTIANQDLRVAVAQYDEARADARTAQAGYYPTLDFTGSASRSGLSRETANVFNKSTFNSYSLGLDLQYEVDVWGRVRNTAKAGRARAQASAGDLATVDLSLHAELATDYFTLRGYDAMQAVLDQTVGNYRHALALTQAQFDVGYAAQPDVSAATAQLDGLLTQAADNRLRRAMLEHAIAILTGQPPATFAVAARSLDSAPPPIAPGLPVALLQRRPDIAAAERRVAAANADIGVARAAYFPAFNINAMMGVQAAMPNHLLVAPAQAWSFGPEALLNVFDGGRRAALNAHARAVYDEEVARYRQTVLDACRDVEDSLVSLRRLAEESATQQQAVIAAQDATHRAGELNTGGLASYYNVILARNIELSDRLSEVDIRVRRMTASVALIKALGGGWGG